MGDVFNMVSFGASSERKLWGFLARFGMCDFICIVFTVVLYFAFCERGGGGETGQANC